MRAMATTVGLRTLGQSESRVYRQSQLSGLSSLSSSLPSGSLVSILSHHVARSSRRTSTARRAPRFRGSSACAEADQSPGMRSHCRGEGLSPFSCDVQDMQSHGTLLVALLVGHVEL